jgi:hypothetical protein
VLIFIQKIFYFFFQKIFYYHLFFVNLSFNLNNLNIIKMEKTLDNTNVEEAKTKVSDIKVFGNGDLFQLICKASSKEQGWMKSTKAMQVPGGCVVQVTTQQGENIAEAITFVPEVRIKTDEDGNKYLGI